ncbi:MAG TPA: ABC transporter permease [Candidatus Polarisedimenticolaceae bacterium]|nr:ABC transporter permease [Candidatus Polarisedimenticolaceae bacterium]
MIRHFLKLAWRRKRGNALLIVEILASFLVVFAVATAGVQLARSYGKPVGFDYRNVWEISVDRHKSTDDTWSPEETAGFTRLLKEGAGIEGVETIAGASNAPYDFSTMVGGITIRGRAVDPEFSEATDAYRDAVRLDVVRGRWFTADDDASSWRPIVVNEEMAEIAYPGEDPVGKVVPVDGKDEPESRIVGVVSDYRKGGELSLSHPFIFRRIPVGDPKVRPPQKLVVRARPGVDAGFEERLVRGLQQVTPEWTLEARPLEASRATSFRMRLAPLLILGLVAAFLLIMVALGMIGVLWQNVTRRAREFGLRRAAGASQRDIQSQVLMEITLTAALAVAVGLLLVAQVPLIPLLGFLSFGTLTAGAVLAIVVVVGLALTAAAYPSWLATRVHPADALRDE